MKELKKLLEANTGGGRRRVADVFRDFCELSALTFRNAIDKSGWNEREARYLEIAGRYSADEMARFAELLAAVAMKLEDGLDDVLGKLYMSLDLGNERLGQFFTPFDVSLTMARMSTPDIVARIADEGFITMNEPACGSGGMVIALAQRLKDDGLNPQRVIHVTAQDLDATAVHMTYVHLTLLHIPAVVVHGNTLTLEVLDTWSTPAHVVDGWERKLQLRAASGEIDHEAPDEHDVEATEPSAA